MTAEPVYPDDYPDPDYREISAPELRLLYVACTRAQHELDITHVKVLERDEPPHEPALA